MRVRRFALKRTLNGSIMLDLRAVEKAMSTSGKVTVERDGKTYAATYTVEGDMVHVRTHTETRSVALSGKSPRTSPDASSKRLSRPAAGTDRAPRIAA